MNNDTTPNTTDNLVELRALARPCEEIRTKAIDLASKGWRVAVHSMRRGCDEVSVGYLACVHAGAVGVKISANDVTFIPLDAVTRIDAFPPKQRRPRA